MMTLVVEQKDVDTTFSLKDLQEFTKKNDIRVIVRNFCAIQGGGVTWLAQ